MLQPKITVLIFGSRNAFAEVKEVKVRVPYREDEKWEGGREGIKVKEGGQLEHTYLDGVNG